MARHIPPWEDEKAVFALVEGVLADQHRQKERAAIAKAKVGDFNALADLLENAWSRCMLSREAWQLIVDHLGRDK